MAERKLPKLETGVRFPSPALQRGNSLLAQRVEPVVDFNDDLRSFAARLFGHMYLHKAVGFAANQVGIPMSLFVYDDGEHVGALANPEVSDEEGFGYQHEGCFSLHDQGAFYVGRPTTVTVRGNDLDGHDIEWRKTGFEARVIQHEIDHLNNILISERAIIGTGGYSADDYSV